jgi:hypothetical protein
MKPNLNKEPQRKKQKVVSSTGCRVGVYDTPSGRFNAKISVNGENKSLGTFDADKQAACAYDQAILKYNKPTTSLNFPQTTSNDEIQIKAEPKDDQISSNSQWL